MEIRLDEGEQVAWETYFSAALATAKSNGLPTNKGLDDPLSSGFCTSARKPSMSTALPVSRLRWKWRMALSKVGRRRQLLRQRV